MFEWQEQLIDYPWVNEKNTFDECGNPDPAWSWYDMRFIVTNTSDTYCCDRFQECIEEKEIVHSEENDDETEWYIPQWHHLYFCPFCGCYIKGQGFGTPAKCRKMWCINFSCLKKAVRDFFFNRLFFFSKLNPWEKRAL
jgi:hypothetical protein